MKYFQTLIFLASLYLMPLQTSAQVEQDSLEARQLHMITFKKILSHNYQGWSVQYREFEAETSEFVIPVTFSYGNTRFDDGFLENKGIKDIDTYALGLGFDGYEHLGNGLYFNLGLGLQSGLESVETLSDTKSNRFLIGGSASTGFLYAPFPEFGLVLGVNVIGRLSNSKGQSRSIGFGLEAGFNF